MHKRDLVRTVRSFAGLPGVSRLCGRFRGTPVIVGYHRVLPEPIWEVHPFTHSDIAVTVTRFQEHMEFLADHAQPVAMDALLHLEQLPANAVVVSFDDFYADVATHALPILEACNIPAVLYLSTDFASGDALLWWYGLDHVVRTRDAVDILWHGERLLLPLSDFAARRRAFVALARRCLTLSPYEQHAFIDALGAREACQVHGTPDWECIQHLAEHPLITIGAHTCHHVALSCLPESMAREELVQSKRQIEERLHKSVQHLAYPFGGGEACGEREFQLAHTCGYATAVTTVPGANSRATPRTALRRTILLQEHDTVTLRALCTGWDNALRSLQHLWQV